MVRWLGPHASIVWDRGLIPDQRTNIPQAAQPNKQMFANLKKKNKHYRNLTLITTPELSPWSGLSGQAWFCCLSIFKASLLCPCPLSIYPHPAVKVTFSCETLHRPPSSSHGEVMCPARPRSFSAEHLPWTLCSRCFCASNRPGRARPQGPFLAIPSPCITLPPQLSTAVSLTFFRPLYKNHPPGTSLVGQWLRIHLLRR